jgi:uncharacterized protein YdcH (DUF465 family)
MDVTDLEKMDNEKEILGIIVSEFPHLHEEISRLYDESSSFIEICEDYVLCLNAIEKARNMGETVPDEDLIELRMVLLDLKEELLSRI